LSRSATIWSLLSAIAAILAIWSLAAWLLPIVQDEAYYFAWAPHLDWGYFDHPPLVALISWPATIAGGSALIARLGTLFTGLVCLLAAVRLFRTVGLSTFNALTVATILAFGNLMGLAYGVIATPDTGLILAWVLALNEAALALKGHERRWLTAGMATGIGLWAKYIMLLIGPVFLWALIARERTQPEKGRGLRGPWPYLGGVVALLVTAPHLYWNAKNDWITLRFQMRHGLASEHLSVDTSQTLPRALPAEPGSREWDLGKIWSGFRDEEQKKERAPGPYDETLKSINRYFGYYGSQIGAWGALLVAMGIGLRQHRHRSISDQEASNQGGVALTAETKPLLIAATAVPLLVFGLLSLGTKVEANWSAMYLFAAAALLTPLLLNKYKAVFIGFLINVCIVLSLIVHANTGILPIRADRDRLLAETHGYAQLAEKLGALGEPIFADSYQITAMSHFYNSRARVAQWPGITRDSEFVRRAAMNRWTLEDLRSAGGFWLITSAMPMAIPGFSANKMTQLRDCKESGLQVISSTEPRSSAKRCAKPVHEWYLIRYDA
jgi:hypothetical protein